MSPNYILPFIFKCGWFEDLVIWHKGVLMALTVLVTTPCQKSKHENASTHTDIFIYHCLHTQTINQ